MAISPLPLFSGTPPNRSQSPSAFNTNTANWINYTTTFQPDFNTFATQANALAVEVNGYAVSALGYSNDALATLGDTQDVYAATLLVQESANSAANFIGNYSSLTGALNKPATVSFGGAFWSLNTNTTNVTADVPGVSSKWTFVSGTRWQLTQTASFSAQANGYWPILATGSAVDATLPAMLSGDFICIQNSADSTQTVRILNAGYTIKSRNVSITSADNIILLPGQMAYLRCVNPTNLEVVTNG